jgi:hypothetical protein
VRQNLTRSIGTRSPARVSVLASVPHSFEEEHATVSPVVLPITSRGIALTDRVCWGILGVAMALAAVLLLYLNRGTTFFFDELTFLYETPTLGPRDVFEPHNGHLIATTRLAYKLILETVGSDYLAFRLLAVGTVLLSAGLFYALIKRRIGALPALAPTFVLLLFGSAWQHVLAPIGFTPIFGIATGLAALLTLERGGRTGDAAACLLLIVSIATYTTGLPFLVGVAVSVLMRDDRWRRAWIFLVPLALYAAWWLWSQSTGAPSGEETKLSNVLLIPAWSAESLAAVTAALVGLDFSFSDAVGSTINPAWGRVLAVPVLAALLLRMKRGDIPAPLWVSLAIVLTWWALGGLAFNEMRPPDSVRYVYLGSVGLLLVAATATVSPRFSRLGLVALFGVCTVSLVTNSALLRDASALLRNFSATERAEFAMLELSRGEVDPMFNSGDALGSESPVAFVDAPASEYFTIVDRYGSLGLPLSGLERESEEVRAYADRVLAAALALRLKPGAPPVESRRCTRAHSRGGGQTTSAELPPGGASARAEGIGAVSVTVGRFADSPAVEVGSVRPGEIATLRIPPDAAPKPWRARFVGARSVRVCPLG